MNKKDPLAIVHDNIESLDDGLEGFQRLFEAVSSNMRMQLMQMASGAPMLTVPSAAERDLQQRLKERENQLVEMRRHLTEARRAAADAGPTSDDGAVSRQRIDMLESENARLRTEVTALKEAPPPPAAAAAPQTEAPAGSHGLPGSLLCALAATVEETLGPASRGVAFRGGAALGKVMAAGAGQTADPSGALRAIATAFADAGVVYEFSGTEPADLTFGACGVREALQAGGQELGGAACYLMCGLFSGAFEAITGQRSKLEIVEAGPTCQKTLKSLD